MNHKKVTSNSKTKNVVHTQPIAKTESNNRKMLCIL